MFSEAQPRASEGSTHELCVFIPIILVFLAKYQSLLAFIWVHVCFVQDFSPCFFIQRWIGSSMKRAFSTPDATM